ncbi:MAG: alpha/beta hydrolase [Acidobacteria bacterium]|nr:MAG: alpha/beta hydrolase [Acidobacteriota bacterium]
MYPSGNLFIPVAHGQLEAILKDPRELPPKGVALVLHPHPLGGGTMHNKVVFRAAAALNDAGLVTLRINFRGVGQSSGAHDFGQGEVDDADAGLAHLSEHYPGQAVTLCGFSFGARVGMELACDDDRVKYLISIGTPLSKYKFDFLENCRKPLLMVHGDRDEFGDIQEVKELAAKLGEHNPVKLVVVPDADHFFEGHLDELKTAITEWVSSQLTG